VQKIRITPKMHPLRLVVVSLSVFGGACLTISVIIGSVRSLIGNNFVYDTFDTSLKVYIYLSIAIIVTAIQLCISLFKSIRKISADKDAKGDSPDSLLHYIESAYENERWTEVIKIGSALSEPLWYTGKFEIRMKIGKLFEDAALHANNTEARIGALLDDLGWTKYRLNIRGAIQDIEKGLQLAIENRMPYFIAKGHRHLCHIYAAMPNRIGDAEKQYQKAKAQIDSITDTVKRNETYGNVEYAHARLLDAKGKFKEALKAIENSIAHYKLNNDLDRLVKMYNFKGRIILKLGNRSDAIEMFKAGQKLAVEISNNVNIIRNGNDIARLYYDDGEIEMAKKTLLSIKKYSERMSDRVLEEEYLSLLNSVAKKSQK
jgi:tetratricopeptide (TPR) repeat protein